MIVNKRNKSNKYQCTLKFNNMLDLLSLLFDFVVQYLIKT